MGKAPKILVTGLGHDGTTYITRLFSACGWNLGEPLHSIDERKGLEWSPLRELSLEINLALGRSNEPVRSDWNCIRLGRREEVSKQFKARIEALEPPPVVKCPQLAGCADIILPYLKPDHVICMHRSLDDWVISMWGNPQARRSLTRSELFYGGARGMGLLLNAIETSDVSYTIVSYPKVAKDRNYAWQKLGHLLEVSREVFDQAYEETTNSDWIGWTEKKLDTSGDRFGLKDKLYDKWQSVKLGILQQGRGVLRRLRRLYIGQLESGVPSNMRFRSYNDG